jgi:rhodanese-related sulfurtransferase
MKVANANLIGDLSLEHSLELSVGPRAKFKYITAETLYNFMLFGHSDIQSLQIIDSRYKYEFDGGHIKGAINIPSAGKNAKVTADRLSLFFDNLSDFEPTKRRVMVFHCEFSSERGPKMYETFRAMDRNRNSYPKLTWPEIYLLKGGYKEFWEAYMNSPSVFGVHGYTAMLDKETELNEVRRLRRKANTAPPRFHRRDAPK